MPKAGKKPYPEFTAELRKLGVPAHLCARLKAFLKDRHPGDQERIYHGLAHTHEVAGLTAHMLHRWPKVPAERKVLLILAAAFHDLDPERQPGTPARVEATLTYLRADDDARGLVAEFCDRFHFTPGQVSALIMATDYSEHPGQMASKKKAFERAHRYHFPDDPWVSQWGHRLAYWDQIGTYLHNTPEESRRRVAGLGREMRSIGVWRRAGIEGKSRRFLSRLRRDHLFTYLDAADRKHFDRLLGHFDPQRSSARKRRG
ncbi:MAG: hypothetical protein HY077_06570 [Elusimicrobia bacterium]|nr:hypothetical protein [Elusimicrobiota bacterium]